MRDPGNDTPDEMDWKHQRPVRTGKDKTPEEPENEWKKKIKRVCPSKLIDQEKTIRSSAFIQNLLRVKSGETEQSNKRAYPEQDQPKSE
jgi:hypothetical protein